MIEKVSIIIFVLLCLIFIVIKFIRIFSGKDGCGCGCNECNNKSCNSDDYNKK